MNIEIVETDKSVEPESGSIIVTENYDYHLVINLEHGFSVYDLSNDECFSYDNYEEYLNDTSVREIYNAKEISVTLKKEVE